MKTISLFFILFSIQNSISQVEWTKDDRTNLYSDYASALGKYKNLTSEQKESISLCCLENTTSKYTKKEFNAKIDIEVDRIFESTISQCSKNIGVTLEEVRELTTESTSTKEWDKVSKEKLAKEFNVLLDDYSFLTDSQKENLSLCCINQTIAKYSKTEYESLIAIELKQHQNSVISKCAKSANISLETPIVKPIEEKSTLTKKNLVGTWKTDDNYSITFNENNTFIKKFESNQMTKRYNYIEDITTTGDWFLDESGILTLKENWTEIEYKLLKTREYNYTATGKYKFVSFSGDFFKIDTIEGSNCCEFIGLANKITIVANKTM